MHARSEFRSLAQLLCIAEARVETPEPAPDRSPEAVDEDRPPLPEFDNVARDARLFRARIAEAVDAAVETVLSHVAQRVLARELHSAPCDIEAVVDACLAHVLERPGLRVLVHPDDVARVRSVDAHGDATLERGDCVLALEYGSVRSTLSLRLADAVRAGL